MTNIYAILFPAEMSVVICEDDKKANLLLDQSPRCLRKLITIKEVSPSTHQRAKSRGVEILKFSDVEIQGAQKDHPCLVSFIYSFTLLWIGMLSYFIAYYYRQLLLSISNKDLAIGILALIHLSSDVLTRTCARAWNQFQLPTGLLV